MNKESLLVKQMRLSLLRKLQLEQESNIRNHENLVLDAMADKAKTTEMIEELEAELEAYEIVNA